MKAGEPSNAAEMEVSASVSGSQKRSVLVIASGALWVVGLLLALSVSGSWFSSLPVRFYEVFPYPISDAMDVWEGRRIRSSRMLVAGTVGLGCLTLAGLVRMVDAIGADSPKERSAWAVILGVLVTLLSILVFAATALKLLLLTIDPSDTLQ